MLCVMCYDMLSYVMLWYVMLCYVMLCYVMLCYAMNVMLCYLIVCYYVMLCYVTWRYVTLCYDMLVTLCYVTWWYVVLCYVTLCDIMLCYVMWRYVMKCCSVMLCYIMLFYVMLRYVTVCYVIIRSTMAHFAKTIKCTINKFFDHCWWDTHCTVCTSYRYHTFCNIQEQLESPVHSPFKHIIVALTDPSENWNPESHEISHDWVEFRSHFNTKSSTFSRFVGALQNWAKKTQFRRRCQN